ncbi:cytochrome C oxidase subunit IV family protein [Aromatoleum aromaticum]|uniref:cytochrome C oxidase subunit IV family protein n=1 Tax=Aromatoleum aromaticum TaxID=551760 RepID=UPI0014592F65|nr:cytochrome C oxidase subunit IV family protein [Aromatoleum aromaticum]NMG55511.1 hypothetical protein [Aromatoleum aromaticum]
MTTHARTVTWVWLSLLLVTAVSWWVAEHHSVGQWTVLCVILIALVKGRLVFLHFMELKTAPRYLRRLYEGWIVGCVGMIAGLYWLA